VPTDGDLLRFAQGVELALVHAYATAAPLLSSPAAKDAGAAFARHHTAHAAALARVAGGEPVAGPGPGVSTELERALRTAHSEHEALGALYEIETKVAATHQYLLENLQGDPAIHQVSAVLPVEGQHAAVLAVMLKKDARDLSPAFQTRDGYYDPNRGAP